MYKPNEQITLNDNLLKVFNLIGVPHPLGSSFTLPSLLKRQSQSNFTRYSYFQGGKKTQKILSKILHILGRKSREASGLLLTVSDSNGLHLSK